MAATAPLHFDREKVVAKLRAQLADLEAQRAKRIAEFKKPTWDAEKAVSDFEARIQADFNRYLNGLKAMAKSFKKDPDSVRDFQHRVDFSTRLHIPDHAKYREQAPVTLQEELDTGRIWTREGEKYQSIQRMLTTIEFLAEGSPIPANTAAFKGLQSLLV